MHFVNEFWRIPQSSFVTAFFMASMLEKCVPLMMFLTFEKSQRSVKQEGCSGTVMFDSPETSKCLMQCVQAHYRDEATMCCFPTNLAFFPY